MARIRTGGVSARARGRGCLACGVHGPAAQVDGRLGARAPASDGRGHNKTGPAGQRRGANADAAASTHMQAGPTRQRHRTGGGVGAVLTRGT
jgi:hypothetical protein